MIYLASPYSHADKAVRQARFEKARDALAWLLKRCEWTYSPIVHCHELAERFGLPTDAKYWEAYNVEFLRLANRLYVLTIPGFRESKGLTFERNLATSLGIPIHYVHESASGGFFILPMELPNVGQPLNQRPRR